MSLIAELHEFVCYEQDPQRLLTGIQEIHQKCLGFNIEIRKEGNILKIRLHKFFKEFLGIKQYDSQKNNLSVFSTVIAVNESQPEKNQELQSGIPPLKETELNLNKQILISGDNQGPRAFSLNQVFSKQSIISSLTDCSAVDFVTIYEAFVDIFKITDDASFKRAVEWLKVNRPDRENIFMLICLHHHCTKLNQFITYLNEKNYIAAFQLLLVIAMNLKETGYQYNAKKFVLTGDHQTAIMIAFLYYLRMNLNFQFPQFEKHISAYIELLINNEYKIGNYTADQLILDFEKRFSDLNRDGKNGRLPYGNLGQVAYSLVSMQAAIAGMQAAINTLEEGGGTNPEEKSKQINVEFQNFDFDYFVLTTYVQTQPYFENFDPHSVVSQLWCAICNAQNSKVSQFRLRTDILKLIEQQWPQQPEFRELLKLAHMLHQLTCDTGNNGKVIELFIKKDREKSIIDRNDLSYKNKLYFMVLLKQVVKQYYSSSLPRIGELAKKLFEEPKEREITKDLDIAMQIYYEECIIQFTEENMPARYEYYFAIKQIEDVLDQMVPGYTPAFSFASLSSDEDNISQTNGLTSNDRKKLRELKAQIRRLKSQRIDGNNLIVTCILELASTYKFLTGGLQKNEINILIQKQCERLVVNVKKNIKKIIADAKEKIISNEQSPLEEKLNAFNNKVENQNMLNKLIKTVKQLKTDLEELNSVNSGNNNNQLLREVNLLHDTLIRINEGLEPVKLTLNNNGTTLSRSIF